MCDFCLPDSPKSGRATSKVDKKRRKCLFLSTSWSKFRARRLESRQKTGEMSDFCLSDYSNPGSATPKVEQNLPNSEKCSTRLPSPKQCGLRLRANLRNSLFARKQILTHRLSRRTSKKPRQVDEANIFQISFTT